MHRGLGNGPDSNQIAVLYGPHVVDVESNKCLSFAGCGHKLHLQTIGLVHLHDGPQISVAKTMLGKVSVKHHGIEKFIYHVVSPGNAVTKCGTSPPNRMIQTVNTPADLPEGPFKIPRIFVLLAIQAALSKFRVARNRQIKEIFLKTPPVGTCVTEVSEKGSLETPDRVRIRKKVIPNLGWWNDCTFRCG